MEDVLGKHERHVQAVLTSNADLFETLEEIFNRAEDGDRDEALAKHTRQAMLHVRQYRLSAIHLPEVFLASINCASLYESDTIRVCWEAVDYEERRALRLVALKCVLSLYVAQVKDFLEMKNIEFSSVKVATLKWKQDYGGLWQTVDIEGSLSLSHWWTTRLGKGAYDMFVICDVEEEPDDSDDEEDDEEEDDEEEDDSDEEEDDSMKRLTNLVDLCVGQWSRKGNIPDKHVKQIDKIVCEVCQQTDDVVDGNLISYTNYCYSLFDEYRRFVLRVFKDEEAGNLIKALRSAFQHVVQNDEEEWTDVSPD